MVGDVSFFSNLYSRSGQYRRKSLGVAQKTLEHFAARLHRLYEQRKTHPDRDAIPGDYVQRWVRWVFAALTDVLPSNTLLTITTHPEANQSNRE
jgi:hypothetical protein